MMAPDPVIDDRPATPAHVAGAYGFSRNELRALVIVGLVAAGWIIFQWFDRHSTGEVPPWVVENMTIGRTTPADSTPHGSKGARSEASRTARVRERQEEEDPGHVLIDINTAGRSDLIRLPGIGATLATRIIDDRAKNGPFANLQDFQRVRGVGPKTAAMLTGWVRFSRSTSPSTDTAGVKR